MPEKPGPFEEPPNLLRDVRTQRRVAERSKSAEVSGEETWDIYDSSDDYAEAFSQVIPARENEPVYTPIFSSDFETPEQYDQRVADFRHYLTDEVLQGRIGQAIGIDFGGPGRNFFADYQGVFGRSLGVLLHDHRPRQFPPNHTVIEGDMLAKTTHRAVNEWLNGEQADFIMERVAGGGHGISFSPRLALHTVEYWYSILREGGVMFFEWPIFPRHDLDKTIQLIRGWTQHLNANFPEQLSACTKAGLTRLRKLPGAPAELPLLSQSELDQIDQKPPSL